MTKLYRKEQWSVKKRECRNEKRDLSENLKGRISKVSRVKLIFPG